MNAVNPKPAPDTWKWNKKYPTRCMIVDPHGAPVLGFTTSTPAKSVPHLGQRGTAELKPPDDVRITLDDGTILWGYECWWVAIPPEL